MSKNPIIIGVSGKKQSGKSTLCESIFSSIIQRSKYKCRIYSFADPLKQKICIDVMGLSYEQCYGSDEQKNSPTSYLWKKFPEEIKKNNSNGFITAREIMQYVSTEFFRKYFDDNIWVNATFRNIFKEKPDFALISDVRFPSEVDSIIDNGGYIIRLLRNVCKKDSHESETALDNYDFLSWGNRICTIDNQKMKKEEKNEIAFNYIDEILGEKY